MRTAGEIIGGFFPGGTFRARLLGLTARAYPHHGAGTMPIACTENALSRPLESTAVAA